MQLRANDVVLNECPGMYCKDPDDESHSIVAIDDDGSTVILSLFLKGVTSQFEVEPLDADEFDSHNCPRIELTSGDLRGIRPLQCMRIRRMT